MNSKITEKNSPGIIDVEWGGPYGWPGFEGMNDLPSIPNVPGVYLQTFKFRDGYLIYAAGITRRPVPKRIGEHTRNFMNGEYTVLDVAAAQQGIRREAWHGWGYARDHREEFEERKPMILDAAQKQLKGFRIFVADLGVVPRVHERIEASIMNNLYKQASPVCDLPDRGMQLSSRWDSEEPVLVRSTCTSYLHGLPKLLEI